MAAEEQVSCCLASACRIPAPCLGKRLPGWRFGAEEFRWNGSERTVYQQREATLHWRESVDVTVGLRI